jgi:hypothetical protein
MSYSNNITALNGTINNLKTDVIKSAGGTNIVIDGGISVDGQVKLYYDANKNTLGIQLIDTCHKGAVYDTVYNRPFEQALPISQEFVIPAKNILLISEIVQNPAQVFVLMPTTNTSINLPSLLPNVEYQNTNVRFVNMSSDYLVSFFYKGTPIIQMAFERISLVWHTTDGINYSWRYVA